jgi:serine/threonine-protein kinase
MEEESLALQRVLSDRILPVLNVEKSPQSIVITLEYPEYPTLAHFMQQHAPLSLILVFSLVEQLRLIFAKLFELGIHRFQLEPDIILIKPKERHLLYTDTGLINLAKYPEIPRLGYLDGKPPFLPPELLGAGDLSAASEVYVFGVFTYYLLTGTLPFADLPIAAAAALSIHEPLPGINRYKDVREKNLNTLIAKATRKNPAERTSSLQEFMENLRKICSPS